MKHFSIGLCAFIFLLLVGCSSGSNNTTPQQSQEQEQTVQEVLHPLPVVITDAVSPPQRDEKLLPELAGEYDSLIPVASDYPIPEVPSRLIDTTNMRGGYFLRPRIPSARTTADGRIGVGVNRADGYNFMLFTPEKLKTHWTRAQDGSLDMMSAQTVRVNLEDMTPEDPTLSPLMFAVCDTSHHTLNSELYDRDSDTQLRNPQPLSDTQETYDFHIFSGSFTQTRPIRMTDKMFSVKVRVVVEDPKTPAARIVNISRVDDPVVATLPYTPINLFEPVITGDGRLLVARIQATPGSGGGIDALSPTPWVDQDGVTHEGFFDTIYAYNPPGSGYPPCDPRGWTSFKPISYAHYEDAVRERYGFAKHPMRDPEGNVIPAGKDAGIAYPWVDARGANIMFTAYHRWPFSDENAYRQRDIDAVVQASIGQLQPPGVVPQYTPGLLRNVDYPGPHLMLPQSNIKPAVEGCEGCQETIPVEQAGPTRGAGVFGLWTRGKMVLMDNQVNGTDLAFRAADEGHRLARLYHGTGGVVRIGNGRTNVGNQRGRFEFDAYWPYNDTMLESHENKLFLFEGFKPVNPHDVVWTITNGHGSAEFAFDPYMDEKVVIHSNMNASMTAMPDGQDGILFLVTNFGDRRDRSMRVQNGATAQSPLVPAYGRPIGMAKRGTRIEPVALGGVRGKGLWLTEDAGLAYTIEPDAAPAAAAAQTVYIGLFVDPRTDAAEPQRLVTLPTGSVSIAMPSDGERVLQLADSAGSWSETVPLSSMMLNKQWTHIGLQVSARMVEVYINGFLHRVIDKSSAETALMLQPGEIVIGSPESSSAGVRGWYDDFVVLARPLVNPQEACLQALGSLIRIGGVGAGFPAAHTDIANRLGDPGGTQYACATDYAGENFSYLLDIPESQHVGKRLNNAQPLVAGEPRPDERENTFCLVCHNDTSPSDTMTLKALEPRTDFPVEFDPRRQPSQPFPALIGIVPEDWLGLGHAATAYTQEDDWLLVDHILLKGD